MVLSGIVTFAAPATGFTSSSPDQTGLCPARLSRRSGGFIPVSRNSRKGHGAHAAFRPEV
jgi:hypothetical protein